MSRRKKPKTHRRSARGQAASWAGFWNRTRYQSWLGGRSCFAAKSFPVDWIVETGTHLTPADPFPRVAPSGAAIARLHGAASPVPTVAGRIAADSVAGWQDPAAA